MGARSLATRSVPWCSSRPAWTRAALPEILRPWTHRSLRPLNSAATPEACQDLNERRQEGCVGRIQSGAIRRQKRKVQIPQIMIDRTAAGIPADDGDAPLPRQVQIDLLRRALVAADDDAGGVLPEKQDVLRPAWCSK